MRFRVATLVFVQFVLMCPGAGQARASAGERPNIVLIMTDDQGWGDTGYNGHPELRTPHLDALAAEGWRLDRFYAAAPVCSPTRASVLTGRHPARLGIEGANSGHLPREELTLAELLLEHGYATGFFGKWHLGTLTRDVLDSNRGGRAGEVAHYSPPWEHGFQVVFATEAKVPTWDPMLDPDTGEPYGTAYWNERGERVTDHLEGDDSRVIVDRVVPFLRAAVAEESPFLAVVWLHAPHKPVVAGREYLERYAHVEDEEERHYLGVLSAVDDQIGRIVAELDALGVGDDTLLWFASDNGPENATGPGSTAGLRGRKRSLYEGGVRVPGFLRWPRRLAPRTFEGFASTLDVFPTVAAILAVEPDASRPLDGRDLLSEEPARAPQAFRAKQRRTLHRGTDKLFTDGEVLELYDLASDRAEGNDLAGERAGRVQELRAELAGWERSVERSRRGLDRPIRRLDESAPRPHVLLILVDDLGTEWLSCYGGEGTPTPNLDALAASGTRFTSAWSQPKCTPSRVTLLTGQYPFRHGWVDHWDVPRWGGGAHFDPEEYLTLPEVLLAAGYRCRVAGKWQIDDLRVDSLSEHGFDDWCVWTGYESGVAASAERYAEPYVNDPSGSRTRAGGFGPDVFADAVVGWIEAAGDEPLLLYYPMVLTHGPLVPTPLEPQAEGKDARHAAMVRYTDHLVGRLVAALDEHGLRERTVVLFTADNGTSRGITGAQNGLAVQGGKGTLSQAGVAVPCIVSWPGQVPAGRVSDAPTDLTDLLPTLAELAGVELSRRVTLDGVSQAAHWLGKEDAPRRPWVLAMGGGTARRTPDGVVPAKEYADRAVSDGRWKLWIEAGRPTRLFDLRADPGERVNLVERTDPEVLAARARLEAVVEGFPERDAVPLYAPNPEQVWDRPVSR